MYNSIETDRKRNHNTVYMVRMAIVYITQPWTSWNSFSQNLYMHDVWYGTLLLSYNNARAPCRHLIFTLLLSDSRNMKPITHGVRSWFGRIWTCLLPNGISSTLPSTLRENIGMQSSFQVTFGRFGMVEILLSWSRQYVHFDFVFLLEVISLLFLFARVLLRWIPRR